jgi:hypothetical protein
MKFAILALLGLIAVQAVQLPESTAITTEAAK